MSLLLFKTKTMADTKKTQDPVNELDELQTPQTVVVEETEKVEEVKVKEEVAPEIEVKKEIEKKEETKVKEVKEEIKEVKVEKKERKAARTAKKEESLWTEKSDLIAKHNQMVMFVQNIINNVEMDIKRMKLVLGQLAKFDPNNPESLQWHQEEINKAMWNESLKSYKDEDAEVVEWVFDWYFMIWKDQKKYPVPLNYSSKTKLVPGDVLKLKIMSDGKFIYKLINPIERRHMRALLSKTDENKFISVTDDWKTFFLNQAAVTFFKGKPWDELYIVTNKDEDGWFAAIEAIIKK